ncbi:hypothetical protein SASPL_129265 [Salvia splendens]|uniref:Uncharacterized protein n=1 Tax=Salvia splendens TaxID=180675 RepID=A0A8X8XE09_SALSN|nr:hypothetical protein SASPL_129265 [Salvia splendens]
MAARSSTPKAKSLSVLIIISSDATQSLSHGFHRQHPLFFKNKGFGWWEGFKWSDSNVRTEKVCFRVRRDQRRGVCCVVTDDGCCNYTIEGFEGKSSTQEYAFLKEMQPLKCGSRFRTNQLPKDLEVPVELAMQAIAYMRDQGSNEGLELIAQSLGL